MCAIVDKMRFCCGKLWSPLNLSSICSKYTYYIAYQNKKGQVDRNRQEPRTTGWCGSSQKKGGGRNPLIWVQWKRNFCSLWWNTIETAKRKKDWEQNECISPAEHTMQVIVEAGQYKNGSKRGSWFTQISLSFEWIFPQPDCLPPPSISSLFMFKFPVYIHNVFSRNEIGKFPKCSESDSS